MQSAAWLARLQQRARGGWAAVVLTGVAIGGAVPFVAGFGMSGGEGTEDLTAFRSVSHVVRLAGLGGGTALGWYWLTALPLLYLLLAVWFALRSRRVGLSQQWSAYLLTALGAFVLLALSTLPPQDLVGPRTRLVLTPLLVATVSLAILGRVERDRRLVRLGLLAGAFAVVIQLLAVRAVAPVPDNWPGEPVLSAATSPQGELSLLALVMIVCGVRWRSQ